MTDEVGFRNSPPGSISLRVDDDRKHQVRVTVCPYGVVDEYKTRWMPGVWTRSLEHRQPPMCWGHNWIDPIGHMADKDDNEKRLEMLYGLDDFDAVPRARQAYAQMKSGTIRDTSFGFKLLRDEPAEDGVFNQLEARLDEVSPVLLGAVPGAGITAVRNVPVADVLRLSRAMEDGEMTLEQALAVVSSIAGSDDVRQMHSHAKQDGGGIVNHSHQGIDGMHAHTGLMPATRMGRAAAPYGDVEYADPGYQSDKVKRYPVDTEEHAKAAWAYISQEKNASKYSSDDLAKVKAKIKAACDKFGVEITDRSAAEWETRIDGVADDGSKGVGPSNKCPKCGKPTNMQDAKFCPHCGATMAERADPEEMEVAAARSLLKEITDD